MVHLVRVSDTSVEVDPSSIGTVAGKPVSYGVMLHGAFFFLLLLQAYLDHYVDFLPVAWLFASVLYVNFRLQADILDKDLGCRPLRCFIFATLLICYLAFLTYSLRERGTYHMFAFIWPPRPFSSWSMALWSVILLDCSTRTVVLFAKSLLLVVLSPVISTYTMGTTMATLECLSVLARNSYAGLPWTLFFLHLGWSEKATFYYILLFALYVCIKFVSLFHCMWTLRSLLRDLYSDPPFKIQNESPKDECCLLCLKRIDRVGVLLCQHKMCEVCVGAWFNRHNFCPKCGTHFHTQTRWRDGSMDLSIQLY